MSFDHTVVASRCRHEVKMLRHVLGALLLLSGASAEDVTADPSVVEDFDFDARQLSSHGSSTAAATTSSGASGVSPSLVSLFFVLLASMLIQTRVTARR